MDQRAEPDVRPLLVLQQHRAQSSSDEPIEIGKGGAMSLLEVRKPAPQHRIEISDRPFEAHASAATRLGPDTVLELVQALLAHETPAGFKTVTQELKALSRLPTVADTRAAGARGGRAAFGPFGPGVFVGCSVRPFSLTQAATSARAVSASSHDRHRITKSSAYRTMRYPRPAISTSRGSR